MNGSLDLLARSIARSLEDPELRRMLKFEIGKKFDLDYNVLFKDIKQKRFTDGSTFIERIAKAYVSLQREPGMEQNDTRALQVVKNAVGRIPKFQIAVPVHYQNWDVDRYVPLVTYLPVGVDELNLVKVKAYDISGMLHWLDAKATPDKPVIVLGINERTDENGKIKSYMQALPPDDGGGGGGGGGTTYLFRATSLTVGTNYESWLTGSMEIYFKVWIGGWHRVGYITGVEPKESYPINVILATFSDPNAGIYIEIWEDDDISHDDFVADQYWTQAFYIGPHWIGSRYNVDYITRPIGIVSHYRLTDYASIDDVDLLDVTFW